MRADEFDYDRLHAHEEKVLRRCGEFLRGNRRGFLPVLQWTLGNQAGPVCRYREMQLEMQLQAISDTLQADTDWYPYLEPWHGVGVFAEAFGCPFEWRDNEAPWTRPIVHTLDDLKRLRKPRLEDAELLQHVLESTLFYEEQTHGEIAIACTDTQSPFDSASLVCDTDFFFLACMDYPEQMHRFLSNMTDLVIEMRQAQLQLISRSVYPGHNSWTVPAPYGKGQALSEDVLYMVSPQFYEKFAQPYNERIAEALGGVALHSCGDWRHNYQAVLSTKGLVQVDLAIDYGCDPNPNRPEVVREAFRGSHVPIRIRNSGNAKIMDRVFDPDLPMIWDTCDGWHPDPQVRQGYYDEAKLRYEQLWNRATE